MAMSSGENQVGKVLSVYVDSSLIPVSLTDDLRGKLWKASLNVVALQS